MNRNVNRLFPTSKGRSSLSRGGGGGGGGVEEFVKKNCRAPKGHKKSLHTQHCEKKICKAKHQTFDRTVYTV